MRKEQNRARYLSGFLSCPQVYIGAMLKGMETNMSSVETKWLLLFNFILVVIKQKKNMQSKEISFLATLAHPGGRGVAAARQPPSQKLNKKKTQILWTQ
jgi:hypothetical protein